MLIVCIDTETTGIDVPHGARPFFTTVCYPDQSQVYWEWAVDPYTREPQIPREDIRAIQEIIDSADRIVGQNLRFDAKALMTVGIKNWPWEKIEDTLLASHLLSSNTPHNLTALTLQYLGERIDIFEDGLKDACLEARRRVKSYLNKSQQGGGEYKPWAIANSGRPDMPSARSGSKEETSPWKFDYWLPKALHTYAMTQLGLYHPKLKPVRKGSKLLKRPPDPWWMSYAKNDHPMESVLREYSNVDSSSTMALWVGCRHWRGMENELKARGLWNIYEERKNLLPICHEMETQGVTISAHRLEVIQEVYRDKSRELSETCINIASKYAYDLELPNGSGNNKSLIQFCFGVPQPGHSNLSPNVKKYLDLPIVGRTKGNTGNPSLDKAAFDKYLISLPENSDQKTFIASLKGKRKRDKDLSDFKQYQRYWLPYLADSTGDTYTLHPSLNPTGSDTLRWSFSRPNSANIKKEEVECEVCDGEGRIIDLSGDALCPECGGSGIALFSARRCLGPAPGREWWSFDAKNIELRIPVYECNEEEQIALFERPNDPPYFGSNHLLNAHVLWPDLFEKCINTDGIVDGRTFKKQYKDTWYQWVKNGDFALAYSAGNATADKAFHTPGAKAKLDSRFRKVAELNRKYVKYAEKNGYVETLPDRTVDPKRGYPLLCTRSESGYVLPTVPLNYHVQGTAMWWTARAMVKVTAQLREWKEEYPRGHKNYFDGRLILQVHDELVLDFPKKSHPKKDPKRSNLWRALTIQRLMASCGDDLIPVIPTTCGVEFHEEHWAEGVTIA